LVLKLSKTRVNSGLKRILKTKLKGSQLIEEGLLIVLALVMLGAVFGVSKQVVDNISGFFNSLIGEVGKLGESLFGWMLP
jgi:Flp pilus assembly pilin Flp